MTVKCKFMPPWGPDLENKIILFYKPIPVEFQLELEIFRTIASFIKISAEHSLIVKIIIIKFFRTI
jgi:hypothetical protein